MGEIVGRFGRKANPACTDAVIKWPAVRCLKDLQSFLGTLNYIRPFCGPAFARVMHPLRATLKKDFQFPLDAKQLAAVEGLKGLVRDIQILHVPDEAAAIEAALQQKPKVFNV